MPIIRRGQPELTWGARLELATKGKARTQYLDSLRIADSGEFGPLIAFATS